jgi:hypothetical protein
MHALNIITHGIGIWIIGSIALTAFYVAAAKRWKKP